MQLLSGWKEIAHYMHLNVRTAQRWEKLGLPVRRPCDGACSAVIADSDEIDQWATRKETRAARYIYDAGRTLTVQFNQLQSARRRTARRTRKLLSQIAAAQSAQQRLLSNLQANCQQSIRTARYSSVVEQARLPHARD